MANRVFQSLGSSSRSNPVAIQSASPPATSPVPVPQSPSRAQSIKRAAALIECAERLERFDVRLVDKSGPPRGYHVSQATDVCLGQDGEIAREVFEMFRQDVLAAIATLQQRILERHEGGGDA